MIIVSKPNWLIIFLASLLIVTVAPAQQVYQYSVDLTKVDDDQLTINLIPPSITQKEIRFYFPKIVPGTYMNSNFGRYVHNLQALDKEGKLLPLLRYDDNGWFIRNAENL